ncbi:hypothetical protein LV779_01750 [Streptomyces thinghirensis]|nr:hypothetical protein [Streptomyces thinghirensis]
MPSSSAGVELLERCHGPFQRTGPGSRGGDGRPDRRSPVARGRRGAGGPGKSPDAVKAIRGRGPAHKALGVWSPVADLVTTPESPSVAPAVWQASSPSATSSPEVLA